MPIVTSTHQRGLVDTGSADGEADCSATGALDKKIASIEGGNGCADIAGRHREFHSVRAVVWLYAAIRPRFGPGIGTAVRSGLAVWFCLGVIVTIHMISDNFGFHPAIIMLIAAGMLPALVLSSIAGAWAYRE